MSRRSSDSANRSSSACPWTSAFRPWSGFLLLAPAKAKFSPFLPHSGPWRLGPGGQLYWLQGLCGRAIARFVDSRDHEDRIRKGSRRMSSIHQRAASGHRSYESVSMHAGSMGVWSTGESGSTARLASAGWQRRCHDSRPRIHRMSEPPVVSPRRGVGDSTFQLACLPLRVLLGWASVSADFRVSGPVAPVGSMLDSGANFETATCRPLWCRA
jgi:hypothetical protein